MLTACLWTLMPFSSADFKTRMSVVVSVHVYSVQKALLKDSGPLYSVDYDAVKDNLTDCSRFSAIRCAGAVPMTSMELQQATQTPRAATPEPQNKKHCVNGDASLTSKPPNKPPKGIMGMFANKTVAKVQDTDKDKNREQKEDTAVAEPPKSNTSGKSSPVINFFGFQTAKKHEKAVKVEEQAQSSPNTTEQQLQPSPEPEDVQEVAAELPPEDMKKDCQSKTKRAEPSDSEEEKMEKKKRRRIKKPEPDSSDDDDVIPDSPRPPHTREPTLCLRKEAESVSHRPSDVNVRKRRRVLKTRTFVDEEGCIVTEKGYESESYSETEDDVPVTKHAPKDPVPAKKLQASSKEDEKKTQKKTAANKGTKQASIMGFFQKK
ncbi:DNA polymerase delta subunit 3-like isoform X2 [Thalassophryne amazonica]|uniref:DNA polymerase delta subunit 3-like isoform X2 n=1 Tax=Thalassophryne amazonica TaxID=390379 RepID=UPI00147247A2|nr:DNA polymerase delta subunit 3-like isoform X2 [Thalassophryne amazonica]